MENSSPIEKCLNIIEDFEESGFSDSQKVAEENLKLQSAEVQLCVKNSHHNEVNKLKDGNSTLSKNKLNEFKSGNLLESTNLTSDVGKPASYSGSGADNEKAFMGFTYSSPVKAEALNILSKGSKPDFSSQRENAFTPDCISTSFKNIFPSESKFSSQLKKKSKIKLKHSLLAVKNKKHKQKVISHKKGKFAGNLSQPCPNVASDIDLVSSRLVKEVSTTSKSVSCQISEQIHAKGNTFSLNKAHQFKLKKNKKGIKSKMVTNAVKKANNTKSAARKKAKKLEKLAPSVKKKVTSVQETIKNDVESPVNKVALHVREKNEARSDVNTSSKSREYLKENILLQRLNPKYSQTSSSNSNKTAIIKKSPHSRRATFLGMKGKSSEGTIMGIPGISFIISISKSLESCKHFPLYNCVLCHQKAQKLSMKDLILHCKTKSHLLKFLELKKPDLFIEFQNDSEKPLSEIWEAVKPDKYENEVQDLNYASSVNYVKVRKSVIEKIIDLKKNNSLRKIISAGGLSSRTTLASTSEDTSDIMESPLAASPQQRIFKTEGKYKSTKSVTDFKGYERCSYLNYEAELSELIELQKSHRPSERIVLVMDDRDAFVKMDYKKYNMLRFLRKKNLDLENAYFALKNDQDFGKGVIYVILCGIRSFVKRKAHPVCREKKCLNPLYILEPQNSPALIQKAIDLHKKVLVNTKNDCVLFCGLVPVSVKQYNRVAFKKRPCLGRHKGHFKMVEYSVNYENVVLYNAFVRVHSSILGYPPWNLEKRWLKTNAIGENAFDFSCLLSNGYTFSPKMMKHRKKLIEINCFRLIQQMKMSAKSSYINFAVNEIMGQSTIPQTSLSSHAQPTPGEEEPLKQDHSQVSIEEMLSIEKEVKTTLSQNILHVNNQMEENMEEMKLSEAQQKELKTNSDIVCHMINQEEKQISVSLSKQEYSSFTIVEPKESFLFENQLAEIDSTPSEGSFANNKKMVENLLLNTRENYESNSKNDMLCVEQGKKVSLLEVGTCRVGEYADNLILKKKFQEADLPLQIGEHEEKAQGMKMRVDLFSENNKEKDKSGNNKEKDKEIEVNLLTTRGKIVYSPIKELKSDEQHKDDFVCQEKEMNTYSLPGNKKFYTEQYKDMLPSGEKIIGDFSSKPVEPTKEQKSDCLPEDKQTTIYSLSVSMKNKDKLKNIHLFKEDQGDDSSTLSHNDYGHDLISNKQLMQPNILVENEEHEYVHEKCLPDQETKIQAPISGEDLGNEVSSQKNIEHIYFDEKVKNSLCSVEKYKTRVKEQKNELRDHSSSEKDKVCSSCQLMKIGETDKKPGIQNTSKKQSVKTDTLTENEDQEAETKELEDVHEKTFPYKEKELQVSPTLKGEFENDAFSQDCTFEHAYGIEFDKDNKLRKNAKDEDIQIIEKEEEKLRESVVIVLSDTEETPSEEIDDGNSLLKTCEMEKLQEKSGKNRDLSRKSSVLVDNLVLNKQSTPKSFTGNSKQVSDTSFTKMCYDHIYIFGSYDPVTNELREILDYTFIEFDCFSLMSASTHDVLKKMEPLRANSVCIFIFQLSFITAVLPSAKDCSRYNCSEVLIRYVLRNYPDEILQNAIEYISEIINKLIDIVDHLSQHIPVLIMPLEPKKIYVEYCSSLEMHKSNHELVSNEVVIVYGQTYKWISSLGHLIKEWNRLLAKNEAYLNPSVITKYTNNQGNIFPINKYDDNFLVNWNEIDKWKATIIEILLMLNVEEVENILTSTKITTSIEKTIATTKITTSTGESTTTAKITTSAGESTTTTKITTCTGQSIAISSNKSKVTRHNKLGDDASQSHHSISEVMVPYETPSNMESKLHKIIITNKSDSVPDEFFEELIVRFEKDAKITKIKNGYEVGFKNFQTVLHLKQELCGRVIGDMTAYIKMIDKNYSKEEILQFHEIGYVKKSRSELTKDEILSTKKFDSVYVEWRFRIIDNLRKKSLRVLNMTSYKTILCPQNCIEPRRCIYYHSTADRRRNPLVYDYGPLMCKFTKKGCNKGDYCFYSHNIFESTLHPVHLYSTPCHSYGSRLQCFEVDPLCPLAHIDTTDLLFGNGWVDLLLFGVSNTFLFLAGTLRRFYVHDMRVRGSKVILISNSMDFLDLAKTVMEKICKMHSVIYAKLGSKNVNYSNVHFILGTPAHLANCNEYLVNFSAYTVIIVNKIDDIMGDPKQKDHLSRFWERCKMSNLPLSTVQKVFVADPYNPELAKDISTSFNIALKEVENPEEVPLFDHDLPCVPVEFPEPKSKPKPSQTAVPWFRKEEHTDGQSSSESDLDAEDSVSSSSGEDKKRGATSRSAGRRACSSHSTFAKNLETCREASVIKDLKMSYGSRSPSISRQKTIKSRARKRSRRSRSQSRIHRSRSPSCKRKSSRRSRSSSRTSVKKSHCRSKMTLLNQPHSSTKRSLVGSESTVLRQGSRPFFPDRSRISPNKDKRNKRVLSSPSSVSSSQSDESEKSNAERQNPSSTRPFTQRKDSFLEPSPGKECYDSVSLCAELGRTLYREFLQNNLNLRRKIDEEFRVYLTIPDLFPDYENVYETFMNMYSQKYTNHSEHHKERLWMEFWRSKFNNFKDMEWERRLSCLVEEFRQSAFRAHSSNTRTNSTPLSPEMTFNWSMLSQNSSTRHKDVHKRTVATEFERGTPLQGIGSAHNEISCRPGSSSSRDHKNDQSSLLKEDTNTGHINSFSVERILTILTSFAPKLGVLQDSMLSIVEEVRKCGTTTPEALQLFADSDNIILMELASKKLDSQPRAVFQELINCLMERAKESATRRTVNLEAIAQATLGKDSLYTLNLIRTAVALEGIDASAERLNEFYLSVCELHFKMAMKEG